MEKTRLKKMQIGILSLATVGVLAACGDTMDMEEDPTMEDPAIEEPAVEDPAVEDPADDTGGEETP